MNMQNNRLIIGAIVVVVALFALLATCAAGAAGGYLIARGQFNQELSELRYRTPAQPIPGPETPEMPQMPDVPFDFNFGGLENLNGALIQEVIEGSPAAEAGLEPGDLIVAVDGDEVAPDADLAELLGDYNPGDLVMLTVVSHGRAGGSTSQISVTLGEHPDNPDRPFLGVFYAPLFMEFENPDSD